jgi:hypothetical protein
MRRFSCLLFFSSLAAATFNVNTDSDEPDLKGTLRYALLRAKNGDEIFFERNVGTIRIEKTALPVLTGVKIYGCGSTISGQSAYPIFFALSGMNEIHNLYLADGLGQGGNGGDGCGGGGGAMGAGGGLFICPNASVILTDVSFENCRVAGGAGGKGKANHCIGGGGGGGGYGSRGGNSLFVYDACGGGGGGGLFQSDGGNGGSGSGGGGGTHCSHGGCFSKHTFLGSGGGGGVLFSCGSSGGCYSSGGGGGFKQAPGGAPLASEGHGGSGGGGVASAGRPPEGDFGGAGGKEGGGKGGDCDEEGGAGNPLHGGGGGGGSGVDNGGAGGEAAIGGGGGGGSCSGYGNGSRGGNSLGQGGGGGGGGAMSWGSGGNGGLANLGGGGGGGIAISGFGGSGGSSELFGGGGGGSGYRSKQKPGGRGGHGGLGGGGGGCSIVEGKGLGGFGAGDGGNFGEDGGNGSALGGAVFVAKNGALKMIDGGFSNNSASEGRDIYLMPGSANLLFEVSQNKTITHNFACAGTITKMGRGTLVFQGFSGILDVNEGSLFLETSVVVEEIDVKALGVLSGSGAAMGALQNSGTVSLEKGSLNVLGKYTQTFDGHLLININDEHHFGYLEVNGQVTLGGTLTVNNVQGIALPEGLRIAIVDNSGFDAPIKGRFERLAMENMQENNVEVIYEKQRVIIKFSIAPAVQTTAPPLQPPTNLKGKQRINDDSGEIINRLTWEPSPSSGIVAYLIYREGTEIAKVSAYKRLLYKDYPKPGEKHMYEVFSIDKYGNRSPPAIIVVQPKY